jgi:hypothetical protein
MSCLADIPHLKPDIRSKWLCRTRAAVRCLAGRPTIVGVEFIYDSRGELRGLRGGSSGVFITGTLHTSVLDTERSPVQGRSESQQDGDLA